MAYIPGFNEAIIAAANMYLATGGLTPTFTSVAVGAGSAAAPSYSFSGDPNTGIYNSASDQLAFATAGAQRWVITSGGSLLAGSDNALNIGAAGANRPAVAFLGTGINISATLGITSPASGAVRLSNNAGTVTTDITLSGASGVGTSLATFGGSIASANGKIQAAASNVFEIAGRVQLGAPSAGVYRFGDGTSANYQDVTLGAGGANTTLTFGGNIAVPNLVGSLTSSAIYPGTIARGSISAPSTTSFRFADAGAANTVDFTIGGGGLLTTSGAITSSGNINANGGNLISSGSVYTAANTVATLPTAVGQTGARRFVTDSTTGPGGFGGAVTGGGAFKVPVYSDGAVWLIG